MRRLLLFAITAVVGLLVTSSASYARRHAPTWPDSQVGAVPASQSSGVKATLAVVGGRLIDGVGGDPLENSVVLVEGQKIVAIGQVGQLAVPEAAKVVDAAGMTVMPGLWESHGHLVHVGAARSNEFPVKFKSELPKIMSTVARVTLLAGVTTFRDTGGPLLEQQALRRQIEAGTTLGPRLYLAGPILYQRNSGPANKEERMARVAQTVAIPAGEYGVSTPEEASAMTERVVAMKVDQIKVYDVWDQAVLEAVTAAAHKRGIGVDADVRHMDVYRTAVLAGVDRLQHVFTADALADYTDEELRLLVRGNPLGRSAMNFRGPYMVPTMETRESQVRTFQFPGIVDHPRFRDQFEPSLYKYLRETWHEGLTTASPNRVDARERMRIVKQKIRRFIEAGGGQQLVAGTDAGSPYNFHSAVAREVADLVDAGLSPMEAIQSATLRPAQMQGVDAQLGTVSVGKLADIIVVDGDPLQQIEVLQNHVIHVIKNGVVYK